LPGTKDRAVDLLGQSAWPAPGEAKTAELATLTALAFATAARPKVFLGLDLRVKFANRAFYDTFELTPGSVEKRRVDQLEAPGWNGPGLRDHLKKVLRKRGSAEDFLVDLDRTVLGHRVLSLTVRRIVGESGSPLAVFLEWQDITLQLSATEKAESHTTELERSNSELEQFAYIASHDLQEPLRMIASYTQLLAQRYRGRLDADAEDFIGFAVEGVHRMQSLIDGLLAYSRVGRRGGELQETRCDDVVAMVQTDLRKVISESAAVITSDPLPVLQVDLRQIGQLFQNLLSNAMKFRRPGVSPLIHISAVRDNSDWLFSVSDNGIGIPADQRKRLFQLFQRLHGRSEYPGTGIGLALCKKIVESHGGRIWLESEPEKGCTFFFTIPQNARQTITRSPHASPDTTH
jgi:signal transduction histidine kinase